jgi:pimeloyl-ACP methyl ester carboxylesterase
MSAMTDALSSMLKDCEARSSRPEELKLAFAHECVERVRHLLEDEAVVRCLDTLGAYLQGKADRAALDRAAAEASVLAHRHQGSRSLDGVGHAAVSASYAVANALAGQAVQAADYAAYAIVYGEGGYGAVSDPESFVPEKSWQRARLEALAHALEARQPRAPSEPALTRFDIEGTGIAVRLAGDRARPALLLIHGFPSSSASFRNVIGPLAQDCFVIAPDLPGFGASEPIGQPSFARFADLVARLLARLGVESFHLYLHDFGAAVGLHLATRTPERIRGLIIQNANAHESGMGPSWAATRAWWADPTPERAAEATTHLSLEGTRDQYVGGVPADLAARIDPRLWEEDWRIMSLPGRIEMQRQLVLDYRSHVARFGEIAAWLQRRQPPALLLWGRHDAFFALAETLSWMEALPRMEAHILDGPHFLLETHAAECAALIGAFVRRVESVPRGPA